MHSFLLSIRSVSRDIFIHSLLQMMQGTLTLEYTPEEHAEISARPISTDYVEFTEAQLVVRIRMAQRIHAFLMKIDSGMPEWARKGYAKCPMWGFYAYASSPESSCLRVYGAMEMDRMHAESAHALITNNVIGGVPCKDMVRVDRWTDQQKESLRLNNAPGWFLDPIAFVEWIGENNR